MGLYKLSSQFTDFIKARSANPKKILEQVSDAINDLGDKGHILPGGAAANTGKLDVVTRKVIENFLKSWTPYPEEKVPMSGVIRRKKPEGTQEPVEEIKLPEMESRNRWSSPEDRMITRLDRERVASVYDLFTKAGVLEKLPGFEERKVRLAERSFEWAKVN